MHFMSHMLTQTMNFDL